MLLVESHNELNQYLTFRYDIYIYINPVFLCKVLIKFFFFFKQTKSTGTGKGRAGRPRKNQANKNQSFMHTKDASKALIVLLPTIKEQSLIKNGHCFMLRNLRKVHFF